MSVSDFDHLARLAMRILLLHLSDLHIKTGSEPILSRAERITDAVRGLEHPIDACVIALSGDVAFSGLASQYSAAEEWLLELRERLRKAMGDNVPVVLTAIPGNHDCDFATESPARANLIGLMGQQAKLISDPATAAICTAVQDAFFSFRDRVAAEHLRPSGTRLYYEYEIPVQDTSLILRCLNTAWVSLLSEVAGQMAYPVGDMPDHPASTMPVISMLHHPTNWLQPMIGRALRQRLQQGPGIVLMGHEHIAGARNQRDDNGSPTIFIDSPALQGHHTEGSAFHAVLMDTDAKAVRVLRFQWESGRFAEVPTAMSGWAPLHGEALVAGRRFPLKSTTIDWLQDPEVDLHAPNRGRLKLDDIFVYLDIQQVVAAPQSRVPRPKSSQHLLEDAAKAERVLITGPKEAGKTCLGKRIFEDSIAAGLVPVFVDAARVNLSEDGTRLGRELGNRFEELYDARRDDLWDVSREDRILVLDNYHSLPLGSAPRILALLSQRFGRVLLFSHDFAQHVQDLVSVAASHGGAPEVLHYRLLECGHQRREDMIDRFVRLAKPGDPQGAESLRDEMRKLLRIATGRYFAPAVPVAIISLLQARAFRESIDLSQSTYGYYYELLIKRSLAKNNVIQGEYDVMLEYLTALADKLLREGRAVWEETWFLSAHSKFIEERGLRLSFVNVVPTLVDRGVLVRRADGNFEFQYGYYYHFFAARALSLGLNHEDDGVRDETKRRVEALVQRLHDERSANTLLFLTHFTKHSAVISPLLQQAATIFSEEQPATLEPGTIPLEDAITTIHKVVYEERPVAESRRLLLEEMDSVPDEQTALRRRPDRVREATSATEEQIAVGELENDHHAERRVRDAEMARFDAYVERMYEAFRALQILGQVLKNFPGSLNAPQKRRITRSAYDVGLRLLASLHGLVGTNTEEIVKEIVQTIRQNHPGLGDDRVQTRALDGLGWYVYAAAVGVVQRIASNVGTPHLALIFEELEQEDPTPAIKLITIALDLDRAGGLSAERVKSLYGELAKNPVARRVLRSLVLTHLNLFDVPRETKQEVCERVDIDYQSVGPGADKRLRRLGPESSG